MGKRRAQVRFLNCLARARLGEPATGRSIVSIVARAFLISALVVFEVGAGRQSAAADAVEAVTYELRGAALKVTPSFLTIPRGVSSSLATSLVGLEKLPEGAQVVGFLRGPSFPDGQRLSAEPGGPMNLPPLVKAGVHFVEGISLEVEASAPIPAKDRKSV